MPIPSTTDYANFYGTYIKLVPVDDAISALKSELATHLDFFKNIPVEKQEYRYAEGKWTLKEMLQHIIDCERVFAYRALAFARQDNTALPGFEEDLYARNSYANSRTWASLNSELSSVRLNSIQLFESFNPEVLSFKGNASGQDITVNAIGFIICGHLLHHKNIAIERYL